MNASARAITVALTVTLPVHMLLVLGSGIAALILLAYIGIALPAVWSAKPARRRAAAALLRQILNACSSETAGKRQPNVERGD
jgi:hypothetical protein